MMQEKIILTAREAVNIFHPPEETSSSPGEDLHAYLATLHTVGARAIIWRILDQFLTPRDSQRLFSAIEDLFVELYESPTPYSPDYDR